MYNNEVTYDKKWDTPENKAAWKKLDDKYFDRSEASPSCPVGWAPEVLELMETLDKEFGIMYNESTLRAYYVQGKPFDHFITGPFKGMWSAFYNNFIEKIDPEKTWLVERRNRAVIVRLKGVVDAGLHSIRYGMRAFRVTHINPVLNKIFKPKIRLGQVKEKYGSLRIYFSSPDYLDSYIEKLIAKTEVKIAMKGCYYPVETMFGNTTSWRCGTKWHPEMYSTKVDKDGDVDVTVTTHRGAMSELGLDMKEMEAKYNEHIAKKTAEVIF